METRFLCGLVAYDGTDYHGFQYQRNASSIQAELEASLDRFVTRESRVVGAGRTDRGVHARGQVVCVAVQWQHEPLALEHAWNAHLPRAIAVRQLCNAPDGFHPRFSASSRTYRYRIVMQPKATAKQSPLTDRFALHVTRALDLEAMQQAASVLLGEHDFATFGQPTQGDSTVRRLIQADWTRVKESESRVGAAPGEELLFTVAASGFLRQMVRRIVGTLLKVGRGIWTPKTVESLLAARDLAQSARPVPPNGLTLEHVTYPERWMSLFSQRHESGAKK